MRQWSRAFIIAETPTSKRVFVNLDICMMTQIIKLEVNTVSISLIGEQVTEYL